MLPSLCKLAVLAAAACVPYVSGLAPTDEYRDADVAQSGYLPNHNMDPAVIDSSQFGQLWKVPFNALEQVRTHVPFFSVLSAVKPRCNPPRPRVNGW